MKKQKRKDQYDKCNEYGECKIDQKGKQATQKQAAKRLEGEQKGKEENVQERREKPETEEKNTKMYRLNKMKRPVKWKQKAKMLSLDQERKRRMKWNGKVENS